MPLPSGENRQNGFSFLPILALEWPLKPLVTPFNFVPFEFAYQAYKMQLLASIPFTIFTGLNKHDSGIITEFVWHPGGVINIQRHLSEMSRPVVLWISQQGHQHIPTLIDTIIAHKALTILIIVEHEGLATSLKNRYGKNILIKILHLKPFNKQGDDRAIVIWKAYLELLTVLEDHLPQGALRFLIPVDRSRAHTVREIYEQADTGDLTASTAALAAVTVYDDYIYYPIAVLTNQARYKIGTWTGRTAKEEIERGDLYAYAREIMGRRLLNVFLDKLFMAKVAMENSEQPSEAIFKTLFGFFQVLPTEFTEPFADVLNGKKTAEETRGILENIHTNYLKEIFQKYKVPRFILVCQSFPFDLEEAKRITSTMPDTPLSYLTGAEDELYEFYFQQIIKGRRQAAIQLFEDNQKNIDFINDLIDLQRIENNYMSALSVFYGSRVGCPVFKTERAGREIFSLYHELDLLISRNNYESTGGIFGVGTMHQTEIESKMYELVERTTALIDPRMLHDDFLSHQDAHVFILSDIPLDFVRNEGDYIGYTALLSRLPITPGELPFFYLNHTRTIGDLENEAGQTVIFTSFNKGETERDMLETVIKTFKYESAVKIIPVESRFELINYVNNNRDIKCLVFFGHGGIERAGNMSWIQLPKDNFYNTDIAKLKYVPKTIVLVGCNTSSGGNTISGMDIPFLQRGCQVIATTFPIPLFLGATFIGLFLSNFLSAGVTLANGGVRYYWDLSDILTVVKRRLRINSILLNLDLQGKLHNGLDEMILDSYGDHFEQLAKIDQGNDMNPFLAIKKALVQHGIIASEDMPLAEIEKIPYCLFFTCLGYTWNIRNKNLTI